MISNDGNFQMKGSSEESNLLVNIQKKKKDNSNTHCHLKHSKLLHIST